MASTRHPRSRTGCWICRLRKKKCDEARPICQQCRGLRIRCDGYGIAQPVWMRDPEAAKKKKEEIKLQIGKRGRRRKKTPVQTAKDLTPKNNGIEGKIVQQHEASGGGDGNKDDTLEDDTSTKASEEPDDDERRVGGTQPFTFEMIEGGIQLLKPFDEAERSSSQAIAMLDSPHPPIGCFRCPIKDSFAKSAHPISGYELLDVSTGKPLIQGIRSEAVLVDTLQLWKPPKGINPSSRTKEEEIDHDEYDAIIASFTSLSTSQTPFGLSEISDPSLIPPIKPHELNLVKNFIRNVFRLTYRGMSESMIHRSLREVVVPMLCTNPGFLKGCMSSSAMHLALSSGQPGLDVKTLLLDALNHAIECIHDLNTRLVDEGASEKTLASILILTSSEVPSSSSNWKPHLTAAIECLVQMDLLNRQTHSAITKFLMSRVIWLDIISALTLGRSPQLWANYREILSRPLHERSYCGLLEMMGCDDTVMLLVSEVMCVEDYKFRTLDDGIISWRRGRERAMKLDVRLRDRDLPIAVKLPPSPEPPFQPLPSLSHEDKNSKDGTNNYLISPSPTLDSQSPVSDEDSSYNSSPTPPSPILAAAIMPPLTTSEGTAAIFEEETTLDPVNFPGGNYIPFEISPDQGMVIKATSAAFRTATRIHLWSIGLGFYPRLSFFQQLLEELVIMITLVPIRLNRIVAWPLLVGGCIAIEPKDREYFASRCTMGDGSLCGIAQIMKEVWKRSDENDIKLGVGCGKEVHWRSVMREQDMEILLI